LELISIILAYLLIVDTTEASKERFYASKRDLNDYEKIHISST